jgi:hypothetical protein
MKVVDQLLRLLEDDDESAKDILGDVGVPELPEQPPVYDFFFINYGNLVTVEPRNPEAEEWLHDTCPEDAQFYGTGMIVEPRYVVGVVQAMEDDGWRTNVTLERRESLREDDDSVKDILGSEDEDPPTYVVELPVEANLAQHLEQVCAAPDPELSRGQTVFDREVAFPNGYRMVIQVIASENPSEESCWTQGVLFLPDGTEVGTTDSGESFLGEYFVRHGEEEYVCNVVVKPIQEDEDDFKDLEYEPPPKLKGDVYRHDRWKAVRMGDDNFCVSYLTPVAVYKQGEGVFISDRTWSSSTAKHITKWLNHIGFDTGYDNWQQIKRRFNTMPQMELVELFRAKAKQVDWTQRQARTLQTLPPIAGLRSSSDYHVRLA